MPQEVHDPLFEVAMKAAGLETKVENSKDLEAIEANSKRYK